MEISWIEKLLPGIPAKKSLADESDARFREALFAELIEAYNTIIIGEMLHHRFRRHLYRTRFEFYIISGIEHGVLCTLRHYIPTIDSTSVVRDENNSAHLAIVRGDKLPCCIVIAIANYYYIQLNLRQCLGYRSQAPLEFFPSIACRYYEIYVLHVSLFCISPHSGHSTAARELKCRIAPH